MVKAEAIRVLLVDDDEDQYVLTRDLLAEAEGVRFHLDWVDDYDAGLAAMEQAQYDAYLVDYHLGGRTGLELLRNARDSGCRARAIMLTGLGGRDIDLAAMSAGAADYLEKGVLSAPLLERSVRYAIERSAAEQALREYAVEMERQREELDAYAHTVAHDLKAPLQSIMIYAHLLDHDDLLSDEERRDCAEGVIRTGLQMARIIDELLLLAAIRQREVDLEPVEMAPVVAGVLQRLGLQIEKSRATISLPDAWPVALGHAPWVQEVWMNYLGNALKYGGKPPRMELGAAPHPDGMVRFWVKDNGRGLTREERERLFIPHTRLDTTTSEGHGLGLSIVRRIVEKLGGCVGVDSARGEGSTFFFTLPAATYS